ncbi:Two-pore potassium channel 3-like [Abeliophyllum distichum]|uniref:Two-pore potassium channel 3-like n=1 Tax=Abeliophyllum distichum TaxID=126358 RepID=A0ABD1NYI4_9LAMI
MEREPLLPYINPRRPQRSPPTPLSLAPSPENNEITIPPLPLPPSKELKDRLIFGSPLTSPSRFKDSSSSTLLDALSVTSPKPTKSNLDDENFNLDPQKYNFDVENRHSWLIDPNYLVPKSNLHRSKTAPGPQLWLS